VPPRNSRRSTSSDRDRSRTPGCGGVEVLGQRHRGVQFDRGEIGRPHHRCGFLDPAVLDAAASITRPERHRHPVRAVRRAALLEEPVVIGAIGVAAERDASSGEVRDDRGRDAQVVVDDFGLREAGGVQDLVEVRQADASALDVGLDRSGHRSLRPPVRPTSSSPRTSVSTSQRDAACGRPSPRRRSLRGPP
jgi:hypothetical protein